MSLKKSSNNRDPPEYDHISQEQDMLSDQSLQEPQPEKIMMPIIHENDSLKKEGEANGNEELSLLTNSFSTTSILETLREKPLDILSTSTRTTKSMRRQLIDECGHESLREILSHKGLTLIKKKQSLKEKVQHMSQLQSFYIGVLVIPTIISLWYASAILFPPGTNKKFGFFLWTDGAMVINDQGQPSICPRSSICSEGVFQIILIVLARLSAFASYVVMGLTFLSKMHSLVHFLSTTYISTLIPLERLHDVHTLTGRIFGSLALLHTISHYLRYIVRNDADQRIGSQINISGLVAILAMATVTLSMTAYVKQRVTFEKRFNAHWFFLIVVLALLFHTERTRNMVLIFFGLWTMDYCYGLINRIHRLGVVEFIPIGDDAGTQMLWRNPRGFNPKSGEYVYIKLPWLQEGGNEWHPFSIYLREATEEGLNEVQQCKNLYIDPEIKDENLFEFTQRVLHADFANKSNLSNLISHEVRQQHHLDRFDTTQVFISPVGDWSKGLLDQVRDRKQLQSCWVRGPFTSPYFITHDFSHIVLTASGIGITPALGVMAQYPGFSRTKILIWSTRSKTMLKFFTPLLKDAHLSVVFYTGKDLLTPSELMTIQSQGNIFLQEGRPESLTGTIGSLITMFENSINDGDKARTLMDVDALHRKTWCVLYCGGSKQLKNTIHKYTEEKGLGWEFELFDW